MPNNISKFFCKINMLAKQVKYISTSSAIRALFPKERIYTDLVKPITFIRYNNSKYDIFLTDNTLCTTLGVFLKNKN